MAAYGNPWRTRRSSDPAAMRKDQSEAKESAIILRGVPVSLSIIPGISDDLLTSATWVAAHGENAERNGRFAEFFRLKVLPRPNFSQLYRICVTA